MKTIYPALMIAMLVWVTPAFAQTEEENKEFLKKRATEAAEILNAVNTYNRVKKEVYNSPFAFDFSLTIGALNGTSVKDMTAYIDRLGARHGVKVEHGPASGWLSKKMPFRLEGKLQDVQNMVKDLEKLESGNAQ